MKLLACPSKQCVGKGALLPPSPNYPQGEPYLVGQYVRTVRCFRCKFTYKIGPLDYARMPELTLEDFQNLAKVHRAPVLAELPTKDLVGAGFEKRHAEDLFRAGYVGVADLDSHLEQLAAPGPTRSPRSRPSPRRRAQ